MIKSVTVLEPFNLEDLFEPAFNSSLSFLRANPSSSISPEITITQPKIYVNHYTDCYDAKITGTSLFGKNGGGYFLQSNGGYDVLPGIYTHIVQVTIPGYIHCELRSQLSYN
jgi:hypothetical protein